MTGAGTSPGSACAFAVRLLALISLSFLVLSSPSHAAGTMALAGQSGVDSAGQFQYSIPIAVPPGTAGMVPSLSLSYSSANGDGFEGYGWTLNGLSAITRCPQSLLLDNARVGVDYELTDRFCLDGVRLMLTSGSYGADASTYDTQTSSFIKIIAHGTAGNGPSWFEIRLKSGAVMELGNTADSKIEALAKTTIREWLVNKITDVKGNYLTATYTDDQTNGQAYPIRIDYTGNAGASLSTYNSVQFTYANRSDKTTTYPGGAQQRYTKRLTDIVTYNGATAILDYQLAYRAGTTLLHSRLTSLTRCDGAGANCLAPMSFGWQGGTSLTTSTPVADATAQNFSLFSGQFTGDGLTNAAVVNGSCPSGGTIYNYSAATDTFAAASMTASYHYWTGLPSPAENYYSGSACFLKLTPQSADINGDGLSDVFATSTYWYPDGSGFWNHALYSSILKNSGAGALNQVNYSTSLVPMTVLGDFNGDGRTDGYYQTAATTGNAYYSVGDGTFTTSANIGDTGTNNTIMPGDFDGDGCTDLLTQGSTNEIVFFCRAPTSAVSVSSYSGTKIVGDFNGDGRADLLVIGPSAANIYLSTGPGLGSAHAVSSSSTWSSYQVVAGDWNGDGKTDVALISQTSGTLHQVFLSTGTDFTSIGTIANTVGAVTGVVADWNSDGADDIWLKNSSGDAREMFSYTPELMTSVSNGIGATTSIAYDRLNKNAPFYTKGTGATYSTIDLDGAYYAVKQIGVSNSGTDPTSYHIDYAYTGAKADITAPPFVGPRSNIMTGGLLSFTTITKTDSRNGLVTTSTYRTDLPFIGMLSVETVVSGSTTVKSTSITLAGHFHFADPSVVTRTIITTHQTDLDGTAFPTTTATYGYDAYNNPLTISSSASDGTNTASRATTNQFTNDTASPPKWIIGELTDTVVNAIWGTSNLTRHSAYVPDSTTGLTTKSYIEPSNTHLELESDYGYDTFGNLNSVTQIGTDIATRTNGVTFDANGEFPTTFLNAMSQSSGATFDARFGGEASTTDPNSRTTTLHYDWAGRADLLTKADGNKLAVAYAYCSGVNGGTATCPSTGNAAYVVTATPQKMTGGVQNFPSTITYYDAFDRVIATDTQGFDGSTIRSDTRYEDATGRLLKTSRPYFVSGGTPQYTLYAYDVLGRPTTVTFPDSTATTFCYHGVTTATTNAKGQTKTTARNVMGLLASVVDGQTGTVDSTCHATGGVTTSFAYDAFGDPVTVTDAESHAITNTFDLRGRKTASSDPDMGSWSYDYDQLSELTSQIDANTKTTNLTYDTLQRPSLRTEYDLTTKWAYDPTNGIGLPGTACTASSCGSASYQQTPGYDTDGRVSSGSLVLDGTTYTYTRTTDADGQTMKLTYPSGFVARYFYTSLGYLRQIKDDATGTVLWTANSADAELRLTQQTSGASTHTVTTNNSYDPQTGNLLSVCATYSSGTCDGSLANFVYDWDDIGNLNKRQDIHQGYTENFCYDNLNRVVNVAMGASCTASGSKTFAYDDLGNITKKSDICNTTNCFVYDGTGGAGPHALTKINGTYNGVTNPTFAYDDNGNTISGGGRTIGYTSYNMASQIAQGTTGLGLAYGAWHGRYKMCVPNCTSPTTTTYYLYDPATGGMSEKIVSGSSVTWRDYIVVPGGGIVALRTYDGTTTNWRYAVADHLGSISAVTDSAGPPPNIERDSYDTWGKRRNADGSDNAACSITSQTTRGYTSQEMLDSICLINMNARIYDPSLGRFESADSIVPDETYGQSYNRYAYVLNNPLAYTDPTGHDPKCDIDPAECSGIILIDGQEYFGEYGSPSDPESVEVDGYRNYPSFGDSPYVSSGPQGLVAGGGGGGGGNGSSAPDKPKPSCYSGSDDSKQTGAIAGATAMLVIEAPHYITAGAALYRGAEFGAVISELFGPEAVPVGLIVGGAVGLGVYYLDEDNNGAISKPLNKFMGQCPAG